MKNPCLLEISSLNGEWCDNDIVMLHACFQLLTSCIEDETLFTGYTDWTYDDLHINAKKEIEELYSWWIERRKTDNITYVNDLDKAQYFKDNQMLIRLINVRQFLWT